MEQRCIAIGASVFVVVHVPASLPSYLPDILSTAGPLRAIHPKDGTRIEAGFIYVAPPDHHLLIDDGHVAVKRGPKENGFRPSIDALFRSAAYSFGPRAIGVVLSGALNDGTSGLWMIKRLGGTAVAQDPAEAQYASMPRSALEYVEADYTVKSTEDSSLLVRLASEPLAREKATASDVEHGLEQHIATEVQIAAGTNVSQNNVLKLGELSPFTCPACQGVLTEIMEGKLSRFRCHTGHGYSEDALLEAAMQAVGEKIWQTTRGLQETVMLLEHVGQHIRDKGNPTQAEKFFEKARELEKRASRFHEIAVQHESLSREKIEAEKESTDD